MKRLIIATLAILALTTTASAQSVEPPVITISADHSAFSPNEITLKRGELVTLRVTSTERVRRFRSSDLRIDVDLRPNQPREISVTPATVGRFVVSGPDPGAPTLVINVEQSR